MSRSNGRKDEVTARSFASSDDQDRAGSQLECEDCVWFTIHLRPRHPPPDAADPARNTCPLTVEHHLRSALQPRHSAFWILTDMLSHTIHNIPPRAAWSAQNRNPGEGSIKPSYQIHQDALILREPDQPRPTVSDSLLELDEGGARREAPGEGADTHRWNG